MVNRSENINVFILHAEEDLSLKNELESHLSLLIQQEVIELWHTEKIIYSRAVDTTVSEYLERAQIILLLISSNFLAVDCYGKYENDLRKAYQRQQKGTVQIIPIILRPCVWQLDFLSNLQPLPIGGYPVRSRHWENQDLAFQNITMGILNAIDDLKSKTTIQKPPPLPVREKEESKGIDTHDIDAIKLLNQFFEIINRSEKSLAGRRILPIVHKSLIVDNSLEEQFKKFKFWKAFDKAELYLYPIEVKSKKSSGRKTIGILLNQENGEEWIYTLKKKIDLGGINGQIRIWFPSNGGNPKISSLSL